MSPYEYGFARGEHQAMKDRRAGVIRVRPDTCSVRFDSEQRGFWDGYEPRSTTWALRSSPAQAWWQEREETTA